MFAQLAGEVAPPPYSLAGLSPLIVLASAALLLIMFRSVARHLPSVFERRVTIALGPIVVVAGWAMASWVGNGAALDGLRDSIGSLWFIVLAVPALAASAVLMAKLRLGFDAAFTAASSLVALACVMELWNDHLPAEGAIQVIGQQFMFDGFGLVLTGVIISAVVLCALLFDDYLRREAIDGPEMYVLMLLSAAGGVIMAGAGDLIVLFLGLETLSIAVYVMVARHVWRNESLEAGLKYFILGAFSSAFLLFGIAWVYGATGSMDLAAIQAHLSSASFTDDPMLLAGLAMLLVGLGFKIAAVPFHAWTPDVYQGAPTPVVAFMASAVKAAGFAALLRVFVVAFDASVADWQPALLVLAILTLLVGSIMAIVQQDVKRMLAYSSIAHAGFILVGVQVATAQGTAAVVFYLATYAFMVIGSFGILTIVSGKGDRKTSLEDLNGLGGHQAGLALAMTLFLLAQAGVPLTSGFVAKFEIIGAAVEARSVLLAVVAMVSAVVSAFVYLRIILAMYLGRVVATSKSAEAGGVGRVQPAAAVAIGISLAVTIGFGIFPGFIDELARDAIPALLAAG